ncbi:MAG: hypothetical protein WC256_06315 [Desulfurivibrionaceae bacterium]
MPIILEFDSAYDVLRVAATDRLALGELFQAMEQIANGVHYPPTVTTIWDLRALDFANIDSQAVRKISAILAEFPARKNARIAYVVASQLGYGMMRMLQNLTETADTSQVFYDYAKADQWISAAPPQLADSPQELDPSAHCQFARAIKETDRLAI